MLKRKGLSMYPLSCINYIDVTLVDDEKFFSHTKIPANTCQRVIESDPVTSNEIIDSDINHSQMKSLNGRLMGT